MNEMIRMIRWLIWIKGHYIGQDELGNRYYQERFLFSKPNRRPRRWVYYKGIPDASRIPAEWHGWIHFTHEAPLTEKPRWPWQKSHQGNRTGTAGAYHPTLFPSLSSSPSSSPSSSQALKKPYEAWKPETEGKQKIIYPKNIS